MTLGSLLLLGQASASFADSIPTSCDIESGAPSGFCASSTPGGIQAEVWRKNHDQASSQQGNNRSTVGDQQALHTAESSIPDQAKRYWDWAKCASVSIGSAPNDARVSDEDCTLPPELAMAGFTRDSDAVPTTR